GERGAGGDADGGEIPAAGLPARRRRRAVRIRAAPVDDRLPVHRRHPRGAGDRVCRSSASALRYAVRDPRRGLYAAARAGLFDRDESGLDRTVPLSHVGAGGMLRIDAHQHYWRYRPADYPWIDDGMTVLQRDYGPAQLRPWLRRHQLDGALVVQARQSERET